MLINESGLVRALKRAYKQSGYTMVNREDCVVIYGATWYIELNHAMLPRKALATIVEHMGLIPGLNRPTHIIKGEEAQLTMQEVADDDIAVWLGGEHGGEVTIVPVVMQGYQIFQAPGGGVCWGVPLSRLSIMEPGVVANAAAEIQGGCLRWENDGELVITEAVRKSTSGWAKEWERAVWKALEGIDLHREDKQ